jgi:hypothetical protein
MKVSYAHSLMKNLAAEFKARRKSSGTMAMFGKRNIGFTKIIRPSLSDAYRCSLAPIKLTKEGLAFATRTCHRKTYQDLIIHISIATGGRLSSSICLCSCSTCLPIVYHLRVEFLRSLLCRPSVTSSTFTTTSLSAASSSTGTLSSCCRLWLRLWLAAERS